MIPLTDGQVRALQEIKRQAGQLKMLRKRTFDLRGLLSYAVNALDEAITSIVAPDVEKETLLARHKLQRGMEADESKFLTFDADLD